MSATQTLSFSAPATLRRGAFLALAISGLFFLAGDRGLTQSSGGGIDPLEVLRLEVRPNAIIVLDTSGSMHEDLTSHAVAGDDPRAKIAVAKSVLTNVVTANQKKVSFMFGQYAVSGSPGSSLPRGTNSRFSYTSTDANARNITVNNISQGLTRGTGNRAPDPSISGSSCTTSPYTGCVYEMNAGRFWNGDTVKVDSSGNFCTPSTTGTATIPPTVTVVQTAGTCSNTTTVQATFTFRGANSWSGTNVACSDGFKQDLGLAACDDDDQITPLSPFLQPEILVDTSGNLVGYSDGGTANGSGFTQPTLAGLRGLNNTPISKSLDIINATFWTPLYNTGLPATPPQTVALPAIKSKPIEQRQRTFVIFVTDGDDTCAQSGSPTGNTGDNQALTAAYSAEQLYKRIDPTDPASSVTTFVIALGNGASKSRADWIAYGGSGMSIPKNSASDTWWGSRPTAGDVANCTSCIPAFLAADADALTAALQEAIDRGASFGEFSAQESITDSFYELGGNGPTGTPYPLDANHRYDFFYFSRVQSTFTLPDFSGHAKAFVNDGAGGSALLWDAGDKLCQRLTGSAASGTPAACTTTQWADGAATSTFAGLNGGATLSSIASSSARIKRRIFTTSGNGVNEGYTAQNLVNGSVPSTQALVPLWPPSTSVAPTAATNPAGLLDGPLGIAALSITDLQKAPFKACVGSNLSSGCSSSGATLLAAAQREAREMLLAFTAGAQVIFDTSGNPSRDPVSHELLYAPRSWAMAESTLGAPAIVTPPPQPSFEFEKEMYDLFRDGPRDAQGRTVNATARGFGMRNPDKATAYIDNAAMSTSDSLKPTMSVVYQPTNSMLYALRAGPCPSTGFSGCVDTNSNRELGGDELWAFVPYDQLGKLVQRMSPQGRTNHTYMMASSARFADVFVKGAWSVSYGSDSSGTPFTGAGDGVWRTILYVGRGAGGKFLTALDVTTTGPFVLPALQTNLPVVVWNRGNPDTNDGRPKSASNSYNNTTSAGSTDYDAYLKMGQTWSVPAVGLVNSDTANATIRKPEGIRYVAWVGSGFSDVATEGKTFYALDALTGDVIGSGDVTEDSSRLPATNALVANVSAFSPLPLSAGFKGNDTAEPVTAVYFPDVQSRIWKFNPDTPTTPPVLFSDVSSDGNQPFGNAVALINMLTKGVTDGKAHAHVFAEAGNDSRVPPTEDDPIPTFYAYGFRDDSDSTTTVSTPVFPQFAFLPDYRGTIQPATAFLDDLGAASNGVVFFGATKFNPPGSNCLSSFDSQIVALRLEGDGVTDSGGAAYDMTGGPDSRSTQLIGQRVTGISVIARQVDVSTGLGAGAPPPPPPPPASSATAGVKANLIAGLDPANPNLTGVGAAVVPFKRGTSVCQ